MIMEPLERNYESDKYPDLKEVSFKNINFAAFKVLQ
jgi:hypothetical protein